MVCAKKKKGLNPFPFVSRPTSIVGGYCYHIDLFNKSKSYNLCEVDRIHSRFESYLYGDESIGVVYCRLKHLGKGEVR